ncbi:probable U3 small nucleolar RNA-associated protein 11 [Amaranthus tricolor]|uniref:probable U3 small nucleolar RNA-associated protein 11 n=1 Tax=Amaranthus tricolor TaxID=29722 RepID=UPI00258D3550|nr:probable U3 small nucleolar RNA-associated protein 11 [Amaranthus tricolor]XP_057547548.1 probable U3 small nucleolar RNA-associated protein 11 [Amaranthus tricolor]XP_057547549.1 probable U3 small nucleolar RNA-associated protein 11 [Amaranthus tricolor]
MSSIRNAIPKRTYKERSQPASRKKFGFLEKHKDYVIRAREYHKKEETLRKLKEKAANRNPDEFNFGMIRTKTINGVHRPESEANKYTPEELSLMKTQDIGYVLQKLQIEKKKVEKLRAMLHNLDDQPSNRHIYFAEDREEAKELLSKSSQKKELNTLGPIPEEIKSMVNASYKELEARMKRVEDLERVHAEMTLQKELQKKGRKRKLREDEIVCPTSKPVYKWRAERKR